MGRLFSKPQELPKDVPAFQPTTDIYYNFKQSNAVIMASMPRQKSLFFRSKKYDIPSLMSLLLQPFQKAGNYSWTSQITLNFRHHFSKHFQLIWSANRQQFYELLLINCNVDLRGLKIISLQDYFYGTAIHRLEDTIPDTFFDSLFEVEINQSIVDTSIAIHQFCRRGNVNVSPEREEDQEDGEVIPMGLKRSKSNLKEALMRILNKTADRANIIKQEYFSTLRVLSCSLLLPQTIFIDRLSEHSKIQVIDLLRFYEQLSNTLKQVFNSNNLISCPLKHFVFSIQDKVLKKKIHQSQILEQQLSTTSQQTRRIRKTREINNNVLLGQLKSFLDAYTEFVWSYLQFQQMSESRFGKIINFQILYGIIFKSVWNFVDWILERGFQYEQLKLEEYYTQHEITNQSKLPQKYIVYFQSLIQNLRNENHPQQYLKKVVLFYREVSKGCENADCLLLVYEEIIARVIKAGGSRKLYLFRMKNVIEKLMKIDQSSLNGGEITYSWATWCILIELLREKVMAKYGEKQSVEDSEYSATYLKKNSLLIEPILYRSR